MSTETYGRLYRQLMSYAEQPAQIRQDGWNELSGVCERLARLPGADAELQLTGRAAALLDTLAGYERYWAFPGSQVTAYLRERLDRGDVAGLSEGVGAVTRHLNEYGDRASLLPLEALLKGDVSALEAGGPHYFTVLLMTTSSPTFVEALQDGLRDALRASEDLVFRLLVVDNVEDAAVAAAVNGEINACVLEEDVPLRSEARVPGFAEIFDEIQAREAATGDTAPRGVGFGRFLKQFRPHLDVYLVTDRAAGALAGDGDEAFHRTFYGLEDPIELAVTVLSHVRERYATPFFASLQRYAAEPVGNFHALPIARGNSIYNSKWIRDMGISMAATSS